ncbi:MAG: InlB B-repeat-containing protein [Clostridia bacterium]|nr:InlB B-repeat-containing protein [Clostridia bacterium]
MPAADVEITATFNGQKYTVEFRNFDGKVLQSGEVEYGTTPEYTGSKPEKEGDAQYSYEFAGWTPEIKAVAGKATYTAVFTSVVNKYTVEFVDEDGNVLQSEELEFGVTPEYKGETPVKKADENNTYEFAGWSTEIKAVDGEATYTAVFNAIPKEPVNPPTGEAGLAVWAVLTVVTLAGTALFLDRNRKRAKAR